MKKNLLFILTLMLSIALTQAQSIPNAGFESWTNMGAYSNPDGWDQLNGYTSIAGVYTCEQGTPGNAGAYYLSLTSKTVTGVGVVPGVAVSGVLDVVTQQAKSGFAFTGQPQALTGKWQHMIFGTSQGFVDVKLTKWNSTSNTRITVAVGHLNLTGMAMSWANFSVPLAYLESFAPDSCIISMSASGTTPTSNDYLWVDELAFTGSAIGLNDLNNSIKISLFPNPGPSVLTLNLGALNEKQVEAKIVDLQGNEVLWIKNIAVSSTSTIDISALAQGNYILMLISTQGISNQRFIKN